VLCIIGVATSCQKGFLDQVPNDRLNIDDVFRTRGTTEQYLANVYAVIKGELDYNTGTPWEGLSSELDVTYNDYPTYTMNLGNWDRNRGDYNYWGTYYQGIRSASYFMQRVGENQELSAAEIVQYRAEARFLRAYFYFMLMRQFGPVVLMPETPIAPDAKLEDISIPRSSFDECVNYVSAEMDKAVADLPAQAASTLNTGRINKGMALAFKSRMLLYAASPLFNGNTDYADFKNFDGKALINQTYDVSKWKKAADAAKAVIDLPYYSLYKELDGTGKIKPYESLKNLFLKDWNTEIIMAKVTVNGMYSIDKNGSPYKVGGWSSWGPPQQHIDAYFMANGRSIDDPASGYTETGVTATGNSYYDVGTSNMYVNREPRFYVNITFNNSKWINTAFGTGGQPITISMVNGGNSGKYNGRNYSRTGYCLRKQVNPSSTVNPEKIAERTEVLIRLGEIYLNYAEALNEAEPGNPDIVKYLNMIRERAGIPQYGAGINPLPVPANQADMRTAIRKERTIELAFENGGHRFFDTRRWKIAEQTEGGAFYGMDIDQTTNAAFTKRIVFEIRVFQKKNYLWNILQDELNKNKNLVENPSW
jgi:hypothetical protein